MVVLRDILDFRRRNTVTQPRGLFEPGDSLALKPGWSAVSEFICLDSYMQIWLFNGDDFLLPAPRGPDATTTA